jgi:hypothetical protein
MAIRTRNRVISKHTIIMHIHHRLLRAASTHLNRINNLKARGLHINKQHLVHRVELEPLHHLRVHK